jgi:hypothetical protein
MKVIVTEQQYLNGIERSLEEDYPVNWNKDEFKSLKSFSKRVKYCEENLHRISSGSARIVYKIDDTKVLKLAKNPKGIAQNNVEIRFGDDSYLKDIVANVFDSDENGLWVEMELARKVTPIIFKNIVGITFQKYCEVMKYRYRVAVEYEYRIEEPENMSDMWENDFVYWMMDAMVNYGLPWGDLCRISTYGLVNSVDNIVLIDYGLTGEVYDSYYK